jgi:hypothetical protein
MTPENVQMKLARNFEGIEFNAKNILAIFLKH